MKNFVAGLFVGLLLTVTLGASNGRFGFFSVQDAREMILSVDASTHFQMKAQLRGYAAGVNDTLSTVIWYMRQSKASYEDDAKELAAIQRCLEFRGANLGALYQYAVATVQRHPETEQNAAAVLMAEACTGR